MKKLIILFVLVLSSLLTAQKETLSFYDGKFVIFTDEYTAVLDDSRIPRELIGSLYRNPGKVLLFDSLKTAVEMEFPFIKMKTWKNKIGGVYFINDGTHEFRYSESYQPETQVQSTFFVPILVFLFSLILMIWCFKGDRLLEAEKFKVKSDSKGKLEIPLALSTWIVISNAIICFAYLLFPRGWILSGDPSFAIMVLVLGVLLSLLIIYLFINVLEAKYSSDLWWVYFISSVIPLLIWFWIYTQNFTSVWTTAVVFTAVLFFSEWLKQE